MQYTIRNIPPEVDKALREKAKAEGKSLNQILVDALRQGLGLNGQGAIHHDLDFLIGTWVEDTEFDKAIAEQDQIDPEIWK
jgi:hypothetical protein